MGVMEQCLCTRRCRWPISSWIGNNAPAGLSKILKRSVELLATTSVMAFMLGSPWWIKTLVFSSYYSLSWQLVIASSVTGPLVYRLYYNFSCTGITSGYGAVVIKIPVKNPKTPMKPELWPLHESVYQEGFGNGPGAVSFCSLRVQVPY